MVLCICILINWRWYNTGYNITLSIYHIKCVYDHFACFFVFLSLKTCSSSGADPGFQVRGGALKKIAPSRGRREHFWGISCEKSRFYDKKIIFLPILGGMARAGCTPPPWIRPWSLFVVNGRQIVNLCRRYKGCCLLLLWQSMNG
jgi:hypothetical protein